MNSKDAFKDAEWEALRQEAAGHLPLNFAAKVLRQAERQRIHRRRIAWSIGTALLLFIGVNGGQWVHYAGVERRSSALWMEYRLTQSRLVGTL